jgi:SAM-dependent methyltransferase
MDLKELQRNWTLYGNEDPLWAILTSSSKKGNKWDVQEFFVTGEIDIKNLVEYINSMDYTLQFGKALDFGCGVGRLTQALANYFDVCIGVDISPAMIENARKFNNKGERCKYFLNESSSLSFIKEDSIDFIYSKLVLQHIEPKYSKGYIQEFLRVLKPGGLLVFQIPSTLLPNQSKVFGFVIPDRMIRFLERGILGLQKLRAKIKKKPIMEFWGIQKTEVIDIIHDNKGKLIRIDSNNDCPPWESYLYFVTK